MYQFNQPLEKHVPNEASKKQPSGLQGFFVSLLKDTDKAIGAFKSDSDYEIGVAKKVLDPKGIDKIQPPNIENQAQSNLREIKPPEPETPINTDTANIKPAITYNIEAIQKIDAQQIESLKNASLHTNFQNYLRFA